ncbi:transcriptional regulator, HxlR family [Methyloceanibacter caenitepidi]|uniref:Transcriptional regulator, HxlR family n=2 Tax=Methyloceanibacter caenitepidi TaxID=1384459 RepID=A0A0A8K6P1_9HYPH|nr:transcriptional regulator, HxlR family [Methyloceanibacter caenitepidi]
MTLDIVGDRWTLVILRDLFMGKQRFSQFLDSPERIATNVLTDRLVMMEREGLVTKALYQERPKRYEFRLTERGEALLPVLQAMARWGNRFFPDSWRVPQEFLDRKAP